LQREWQQQVLAAMPFPHAIPAANSNNMEEQMLAVDVLHEALLECVAAFF